MNSFEKFLSSPSLVYVFLRYLTYVIQFANSLLIAKYLGTFYFGIYSFILLFMQYFMYSNLGLNESLNVEGAIYKNKDNYFKVLWNTSFFTNSLLAFAVGGILLLLSLNYNLFLKYNYQEYYFRLILLLIIINFNVLFTTYYKLYGILWKINIYQLLPHLFILILIFIYKEKVTIELLLNSMLIGNVLALFVYFYKIPIFPKFKLSCRLMKRLIYRGVSLLLFNMSLAFIKMSLLTFVSVYYLVEEFGLYSFANTLSNAIVMAGGAFLFIFYPKILKKMNTNNLCKIDTFIKRINNSYVVGINVITFASILFFPLIGFFTPKFVEGFSVFKILIVSQVFINNSSPYATFLISRKKEHLLVIYAIVSILIVVLLSFLIKRFTQSYDALSFAVLLASLCYVVLIINNVVSQIGVDKNYKTVLREVFGGAFLPMICIIISVYKWEYFLCLLGFVLFVLTNGSKRKELFGTIKLIVNDSSILKI